MKFEYVLLGLLTRRPYSGYDLRKWLETEGQFLWARAHHSQIYRKLAQMEADGWVRHEVDAREGRPDAKVYRLTERGHEVLLEWVRSPYEPPSRFQEIDFIARFSVTGPLDKAAAIRLVETELAHRRKQIAENRNRDRTLHYEDPAPGLDQDLDLQIHNALHRLGAAAMDRWVAWLEETRESLTEGKPVR
ncbi:PadR family transcriptional regulator [Streptomyces sp. VRA16 Mangrove soil]|uniref:PadR family transcriptional regulator n=1 Tax=Streptomyces sp. VRA16 Mangrove soil TaxID=2817434 RepID=UPI001A9EF14F|nr:PadR family transcriptional regulator [Streptomyces sp. VRA16 Mangrove soil]MBO1331339.1 PadR family transcriptional regulator [Streptomyces sp. VRA16 Mangrove soil]